MNIAELTENTAKVSDIYAARFSIKRDKDWYFFKLIEEVGELTKEYNNVSDRGRIKNKNDEKSQKDFANEAADVLAHLLLFAKANNIDLEAAIRDKWFHYLNADI